MKHHRLIFSFVFLFLSIHLVSAVDNSVLHLNIDAGLMVFNRPDAADRLAAWAEENGGYYTWKSDDKVVLRVPAARAESFRNYVESISDSVIRYGRTSTDLRGEILQTTSALKAREEILARNLNLLDSSDFEGTLDIEQEIRRLIQEIDASRGRLLKLENDALMARISVALSFRSQTLPDHLPSSFTWINRVDFYDFVSGYSRSDAKRYNGKSLRVPEDFAELKDPRSLSAISPEGVRLRVVRVPNYPEQTSGFWLEALETDLAERGYLPVSREIRVPLAQAAEAFDVLLWGMPMGEEDYLYLTGLRVRGRNIELLEMTGKAEHMAGYLE